MKNAPALIAPEKLEGGRERIARLERESSRPRKVSQSGASIRDLEHLESILGEVGSEGKAAARTEKVADASDRRRLHETLADVASLGPRVRKIDEQMLDALGPESIAEHSSRMEREDAHVLEPGFVEFSQELEHALQSVLES